MTTSPWDRSRRIAAAASVLSVIAVIAGAVIVALGMGVLDAWWPHTGQAFVVGTRAAPHYPCALIVSLAKAYCQRGSSTTASAERPDVAGAAWRLVPAGAGAAALVASRARSAASQGRR
ncbi:MULTISPECIES: hypothetical protein [Streptomyces]|uniref:Integral membrane protein n=1 Tax=Streptomyces canarius TaxID=285453 RepID=A0ABQ3D102_9ACTN|nr:hypothetical protein [Streptomyces canarius]GHA51478.1 hypothetical protein GCM10010345_64950 [Streptomyces canarius]